MLDQGTLLVAACVVAVAVAAWPFESIKPGVSGDWSWVATLSYAAEHSFRFGSELVWSYGPLGFLENRFGPALYYDDVQAVSWLYTALIQLLLAGSLLAALRRSFALPVAAVVAAAVCAVVVDRQAALALVWCGLALQRADTDPRGWGAAAFAPAIGVLAGVALLGKLNQGIEIVVFAGIVLGADRRGRDALVFAGALLASFAAGWIATGQALGDAWPYVRDGVEVVAGYAAAMGIDAPGHRWAYAAGAALIALSLALAWATTREWSRHRRLALTVLCAAYAAFTFKEGFVRQDVSHLEVFFGDAIVPFVVLPVRAALRPAVLAGATACALALGGVAGAHAVVRRLDPYENAAAAADQLRTLVSPSRRAAVRELLRLLVQALYDVPAKVVEAVGDRPTMLWPMSLGDLAWAYGLDLRPLPTLEPYATYTSALDRTSADMLASSRAPARIVWGRTTGLDGRNVTFEAPLPTLQILCRYRSILTEGPWQVLARAPNRCGPPRSLRVVSAAWGEQVAVPLPRRHGALVLVRIDGAGERGLERLEALALRPHARRIDLDGQSYRLVAATAADGLLLSAPPSADYAQPFTMAPNPYRIAIRRDGGQPGGRIAYRFEEVPIRPFRDAVETG